MRRVEGLVAAASFSLGCAPAVQHLGGNAYRLNCEEGIAMCRQTASRVCRLGYDIVESSTAPSGAGSMLVDCATPKKPKPVSPVHVVLDEQCPAPMPEGIECVRNFQCAGEGARCIDGKCVAATTVSWFDAPGAANTASDATSTTSDAGAPAPAVLPADAGR